MQITMTGLHITVTPSMKTQLEKRFERLARHFDSVRDAHCVFSVEKLVQKVEATLHVRSATLHAEATDTDMYTAIDLLSDKLDRLLTKEKEKRTDHHAAEAPHGQPPA